MTDGDTRGAQPLPFPTIRQVDAGAPFRWLKAGWRDLRRAPAASLFYGAAFAVMGMLLHVYLREDPGVTLGLATGFTLVGPFLAIGLYDISRRLQEGRPVRLLETLTAWRANIGGVGLFAVVFMLVMATWVRVSVVIVALFFSGGMPTMKTFLAQLLSLDNLAFAAIYVGVGALFATFVYAVSVVSIPLLLDRSIDAITAMIASFVTLVRNPGTLAVWAAIIVAAIGVGMLPFYLGLIVTGPLIGHAAWHAFRDLVAPAQ
ncbi:MAG TPA: DUF2189 domain-containing protein [Pelomicrobium sp.]|nr:DUF2189 domain-containing protein [Pelomicrobium sp.]